MPNLYFQLQRLFFPHNSLVLSPLTLLTHTSTRLFSCALAQLYSYRIEPTYRLPITTTIHTLYLYIFPFCFFDIMCVLGFLFGGHIGKIPWRKVGSPLIRGAASYIF